MHIKTPFGELVLSKQKFLLLSVVQNHGSEC